MLTSADRRYFRKAKEIASDSDFKRTHVGCVAVYQGTIVCTACNSNKTHPAQLYYNRYREEDTDNHFVPKLHAEINCLNSLRHMAIDFSKVRLYIYRTRHDQPFGMARPCPSCMAAIRDLGIRHIYYTTDDGYAYEKLEPLMGGFAYAGAM